MRDATLLAEPRDRAIWRVSTTPTKGPDLVALVARAIDARWYLRLGRRPVWISTDAGGDAGAKAVRAAVRAIGGHATLVRAPDEVRASVDVFEPLSEPVLRITTGIKASFDPNRILNPGRMYAGV